MYIYRTSILAGELPIPDMDVVNLPGAEDQLQNQDSITDELYGEMCELTIRDLAFVDISLM